MPQRRFQRNYASLSARIGLQYFKYGCFCSSHPIVTILFSIATLLLLSYPLTRLRLASSAPFEIITADNISDDALRGAITDDDMPKYSSWLFDGVKRKSPMAYIQQIVIRARVHPWNSFEMTSTDAVKGPLELAFDLTEKLNSFRYDSTSNNSQGLDDYCFRVQHPDLSAVKLHTTRFPSHKCLILSPALFWGNDRQKFFEDNNVLDTIYEPHCTTSMCIRNLLFGMEIRHTGAKRQFRTNRQRDILFAVTIVLYKYDEHFIESLRKYLESDPAYFVEEAAKSSWQFSVDAQRSDKFILIYYLRHNKDLIQHVPLALSYFVLFVYLYFSVRKIEMVKSKWGLAFSAVFTIAASLVMATGICVNFDLTPRLWRGDLFPYLAMILGIENVIALTRSVVQTPVTLPVELRVAHGLSREGWLITKNFLIELAVVLVGVLTRIPEIQEFCTLGTIGLVVDFYMQLFFYAPCLTFDLLRFDEVEIQRLSVMQLKGEPVELVPYPSVRCPAIQFLSRFFPSLASHPSLCDTSDMDPMRRTRSMSSVYPGDSGIGQVNDNPSTNRQMGHRRTASNTSDISLNMEPPATNIATTFLSQLPLPRRLKILLFWSRYRYCQKIFTVVVIVWISWLGLIVHQWHFIGKINYSLGFTNLENQTVTAGSVPAVPNDPAFNQSAGAAVESSWVHWALGQRTTFRWWPILYNIYNISLTGEHLVILPRIMLNAQVAPDRAKIIRSGMEPLHGEQSMNSDRRGGLGDLGVRISWLEFQMLAVLIMSVGIFLTVGGFILYVCFAGGDSETDPVYETDAAPRADRIGKTNSKKTHKRVGSKAIVEAVPLLFSKHEYEVEFVLHSCDVLVSACLDGRILTWDAKTADILNQVRPHESRPPSNTTPDTELRHRRAGVHEPHSTDSEEPLSFPSFDEDPRTVSASVWCLDVQSQLIASGFSNGDIELYDLRTGLLRGRSSTTNGIGATQICLKGSHVIVARLSGQLDFMELRLVQHGSPQRQQYLQCYLLKSITAHQHPINRLTTTTLGVVTASDDHTLKLFDLHKYCCTCTFYGHNAPVINAIIDQDMQMMYTSCTDGLVCIWDLVDRCLIRTLPELSYTASPVALAFTNTLLIGHAQDGGVWLWKKSSGELITRLKAESKKSTDGKETNNNHLRDSPSLVVLNGNLAVTANGDHLRFWDLEYKAMLREVKLDETGKTFGSSIKNLITVGGFSVVCSKGSVLYRVDFPVIRMN